MRACEKIGSSWKQIKCPTGKKIKIVDAMYGRQSKTICYWSGNKNINCKSSRSLSVVKARCENKLECSVAARNSHFGDPCRGTRKYLEVIYKCRLALVNLY